MSFIILADENVDHRVVHTLRYLGHVVDHVDFVSTLGKGSTDDDIAAHSLEHDHLILTSDDDFLRAFESSEYAGLLFIENDRLPPGEVAEIVHNISKHVSQSDIDDVFFVSSSWL